MKKIVVMFAILFILGFAMVVADKDKSSGDVTDTDSGGEISDATSEKGDDRNNEDSVISARTDTQEDSDLDSDSDGSGGNSGSDSGKKVREQAAYTFYDTNNNEVQVMIRTETKERDGEIFQKIKVRGVEADSDVELNREEERLMAKLSNGNKNEVKIMPNTASERALERLKTNHNLSITLKEVGNENETRVVYDIEGNRTTKILGLFRVTAQLRARVDSQTGEIIEFQTPWWYFLVGKEILTLKCDAQNLGLCDAANCINFGVWYNESCVNSCPSESVLCSDNESYVSRNLSLSCEFDVCPVVVIENPVNDSEII